MKRKLLKGITTLAIILPCLVGCEKYKEGELVTATSIFNAFEEEVDYTKSFIINVDKFGELKVEAHDTYFTVNNFNLYDSFYLADINGDGYLDFCTDYLFKGNHGYDFYDMKHKEYISSYVPSSDYEYSYYLGSKDGALIIKEMYKRENILEEQDYCRRTATLLTSKSSPKKVWKNEEFKLHSFYSNLSYVYGGGSSSQRFDDGDIERNLCETNRVFNLLFVYDYSGVISKKDYEIEFEESEKYSIEFDSEWTGDVPEKEIAKDFIFYKIIFTEEGNFDLKVTIQGIEDTIYIGVDNERFNKEYKNI